MEASHHIRTFEEVFEDHLILSEQGDFVTDMHRNYSPDTSVLTGFGTYRGYDGITELAKMLEDELPNATYQHVTKIIDKEIAFLEWTASSDRYEVKDGVDSYLFKEGKIVAQTIHYTLTEKKAH